MAVGAEPLRDRARPVARTYARAIGAVLVVLVALLGAPTGAQAFNLNALQSADRVLGQPDFTTVSAGPDTDVGFRTPSDVAQDSGGRIWVADRLNNRVVRYASTPAADGAAFDLVLGQSSTTSVANAFWGCGNTRLYHPSAVWISGTMLFVADEGNNRVLVWTTLPTTNGEPADIALGQPDTVTCTPGSTATKMNGPTSVWSDGTRVLVADTLNNRVLAWTSMPGTHGVAANFALGQTSLTATLDDDGAPTAGTLDRPQDVWSNGTRVLVADTQNNRILAWNAFPGANGAPATWAIGQANLTTETWWVCGDDMLGRPTSVVSTGTRIVATSAIEDRALAWNAWPTAHQPVAAWSFGQPDLVACQTNRNLTLPTAATLRAPGGAWTNGTTTWIADSDNNRVLQFAAWPTANGPAATRILGQTTAARSAVNAASLTNTFLFRPFPNIYAEGLSVTQNPATGGVFVSDNAHNRVSYYATEPGSNDVAPTWIMGQPSSSSSYCNGANAVVGATTVCGPRGMWTDGTRFVLADQNNHRVLIWNTMPSAANDPPDLVLGQSAFTTNARGTTAATMFEPFAVASDGRRLYVADFWNNRILGWSSWPTTNGQAADIVLGQTNFTSSTANSGGVSGLGLNGPTDIDLDETGRLAVADQYNHRILVWRVAPLRSSVPADFAIGQASLTANGSGGDASYVKGVAIREGSIAWTNDCGGRYLAAVPQQSTASGSVIGTDCTLAPSASAVAYTSDIHLSSRGELWLGDDGHGRILRWSEALAPTITVNAPTTYQHQAWLSWSTNEATPTAVYWGPTSQAAYTGYPKSRTTAIADDEHGTHITEFTPGTYYYRVRAVDGNGNATVSPEYTFTIAPTQPAPVSELVTDGAVDAHAVVGNDLYFGGSFQHVGQRTGPLVALSSANGSVLPRVPEIADDGSVSQLIYAIEPDGAGGWYAAGRFDYVAGGTTRHGIVHLRADGSLDPGFTVTINDYVRALELVGDRLYVGGEFVAVNGSSQDYLAAVDADTGALVASFAPVITGGAWASVHAVESRNGVVYFGGTFTTVGGLGRTNLAAVGVTGTPTTWAPSAAGSSSEHVGAIAIDSSANRVYVAGDFSTSLNGDATISRLGAVTLTGTGTSVAWDPNPSDDVSDLELVGDQLWVVGSFTSVGGAARNHVAALDLPGAVANATFVPPAIDGDVIGIDVDPASGRVYVAGAFDTVNAVANGGVAALSATTGVRISGFAANLMGAAQDVDVTGATVLVGGSITGHSGTPRDRLAKLDMSTGTLAAWDPGANDAVEAMHLDGSRLYVAGLFTSVAGTARSRVAAFDLPGETLNTTFVPVAIAGGAVDTVATSGTNVYLGGAFTTVNGAAQAKLARLSSAGSALAFPTADSNVEAIEVAGSNVFVAGNFTTIGATARRGLARLSTTGTVLAFPDTDGQVRDIAIKDGKLFYSGSFNNTGGVARTVARADIATQAIDNFDPVGRAHSLTALPFGMWTGHYGDGWPNGGIGNGNVIDVADGDAIPWNPDVSYATTWAASNGPRVAVDVSMGVNRLPWSGFALFDAPTYPSITDNQGDLTWRSTAPGAIDVDLADTTGLSRYYVSVWGAADFGSPMRQDWTEVTAPALSGTSFTTDWSLPASTWTAMAQGTNHVSVRVTSTSGGQRTLADAFTVQKDTTAPVAPTIGATSPTATSPALGWTTPVEAATASSSGDSYFRVERGASSTGPWTQVSTDGSVTTGAFVDSAASVGTHWYRVRSVDVVGNLGAWSNVISVAYSNAPSATTLVSPAAAATVSTTPTLTATFSDLDGGTGTLDVEVCSNSGCTTVVRTGASGSVASGANGSWVVSPALAAATNYWWRARGNDGTFTGAWTTPRAFTTISAPTVTSTSANTAPQGRKGIVVQVLGTGFASGATVAVSGTGISVTNTAFVSATRIDVTLDLAATATVGARNVTVTNPDTGVGTGSGVFSVTAPSLSITLSSLGYSDAARDTTAPYALSWGMPVPGTPREIGPAASGQTLAGPALEVAVTSDTTWQLTAATSTFTSGSDTFAASQMRWKHFGVAEAWTSFAATSQVVESSRAPGSSTQQYDAQLTVPVAQAAGTYTSTLTWTVVAQP